MHLLPNTVTRLEAKTIFVLGGSEAEHWRSGGFCLEDLVILAATVLQACPRSKFGCKAYRGLEAGRRADLRTA
jgi:hypothetical protein